MRERVETRDQRVQTCPVNAVTPMVPTPMSLFPFMSCCRLGTAGNCSSACRNRRRFSERFSCRVLAPICCTGSGRLWPLHRPTERGPNRGVGLAGASSEWEEQQLLVSEVDSLLVQVGGASSREAGRKAGSRGRGGGGEGGGGEEGGRTAGGGRGDGGGEGGGRRDDGGRSGRHGWKPLHLGPPFVVGEQGSNSFRVSTLSRDFVLQRFFCKRDKNETSDKRVKLCRAQAELHQRL